VRARVRVRGANLVDIDAENGGWYSGAGPSRGTLGLRSTMGSTPIEPTAISKSQKGFMEIEEMVRVLAQVILQMQAQSEPAEVVQEQSHSEPWFCQARKSWILPSDQWWHPQFGQGRVVAWDSSPEWKLCLEFSKWRARREEGKPAHLWGSRKLIAVRFLQPIDVGYDVTLTQHRVNDNRSVKGQSHLLPHIKELDGVEKAIEGAKLAARIRRAQGGADNGVRCEVCGRPAMSWKTNRCRGCFSYGRFDRSPDYKRLADRQDWDDHQSVRPLTPANPKPRL